MLKTIKLHNLLSFGENTEITFNKGLNVLIGANGSGKSNLIEAISLLQAMPRDLGKVISDGGGIEEWLWKGEKNPVAEIETVVITPSGQTLLHTLYFNATKNYRLNINAEVIFDDDGQDIYIFYQDDPDELGERSRMAEIVRRHGSDSEQHSEDIETNQSILAQRKDLHVYPEITNLGKFYQKICLYREWQFGRDAELRRPQRTDFSNDFLEEDARNLAIILNSFSDNREAKRKLLDGLKLFYEGIEDFNIRIYPGGYVGLVFQENNFDMPTPAARLSDGTLRYLSLLAILLHPNPPPLICIEEPELGLHPDILPTLIDLLKEAAQKTQIIITTHSSDLIDALSDMPEAVLVFDKQQGLTTVSRLNKEDLADWLEDYSLGQLWNRGHIGGNRW